MNDNRERLLDNGASNINESQPDIVDNGDQRQRVQPEDIKPLSRQQVNQCLMEVEDIHPFKTEHIADVIPVLRVFRYLGCCKKKKDFKYAMRHAIIAELREEFEPNKGKLPVIPENEEHSTENPFLLAGYGVNSFFDIMQRLLYMFIGISLFIIPVMIIYSSNIE